MTDDPEITDPRDPYRRRGAHRVSAGPYTVYLPANGVAILFEDGRQLPGGVGYLDALVQFAGEVIRARAEIVALRENHVEVVEFDLVRHARADALEEAARLHENINPACDHERQTRYARGSAMGAIIEYRDAIRELKDKGDD